MKELERLAFEYRLSWIYGNVHEPMSDLDMDRAYMDGFRKAREMAVRLLTKDYFCCVCGADDKIMKQLGESEVG